MKIGDLREHIEKSNAKQIKKALAECYKQIPKSKKEDFDPVLINILEGKEVAEAKKVSIPWPTLKGQIDVFLEDAYAGFYFSPNRIIPKNQRPKWRFMVKGYIKSLTEIKETDECYAESADYLSKLYKLLSEACVHYIFSTEDAFRSVGIEQPKLYSMMAERTFSAKGYTEESCKTLLWPAVCSGLSTECIHQELMFDFVSCLKTADTKYMAVSAAKELVTERSKKVYSYNNINQFMNREGIQHLCEIILLIKALLGEMKDELKYYFRNETERNKEVALYCGLDILEMDDLTNDWITLYEYACKYEKIKPRDVLVEKYQELLQNT